jgi:SAM-dependent methyltransferase
MSFCPLPAIFLEDLVLTADRPAIEVGCGDGRFSTVLAARGVRPWRLDRIPPRRGTVADAVADVRALPLPDGSVALLVAANLLRHLWPARGSEAVPETWRRCLAPDGRLWIFEDEPVSRPPAARHYRDAMTLLARLDPGGRRPLLTLGRFLARLDAGARREGWRHGMATNEAIVEDPGALTRLLGGQGGGPEAPGVRLAAAIRRDGISYGPFWWARWTGEDLA